MNPQTFSEELHKQNRMQTMTIATFATSINVNMDHTLLDIN